VVYDRPLRNLMERINQYLKDRTESFDDLYPVRRHRPSFERVLSWLSGYKFLHNYVLANSDGGGHRWSGVHLRGWRGPSSRQDHGMDNLPGLGGDGARGLKLTEPPGRQVILLIKESKD
jgi:hypothetical protein